MIDPGSLPGQTASLDFGEQAQFNRERQSIASAGRPAAPPQGPQGAPQPGPAGPAPTAGGPPTQPADGAPAPQRTPLTAQDLQPGGPVFSQPQLAPRRGWQDEMRTWAAHPAAGPWIGAVARKLQQGGSTAPVPGRGMTGGGPPPVS